MKEPATFPTRVWTGLSDNPSRTSLNDDIPPDTRDWDRIVSEVIAVQNHLATQLGGAGGVPLANTSSGASANMYVLLDNAGSYSWHDLEAGMETIMSDNPDMDNRYESYSLDPLVAGVKHGTPLRVYITVGAKGTGSSDDGNLTANTVLETAAFAGYIFTVNTSASGNRTNPVTTYNAGDTTYTCTVPNTGNTTWNAIIASWNAAQSDVIIDHPVSGNYVAGVTTTGNSTILIGADGVLVEQRVTTCNITANAREATVFGLAWNGSNNGTTTPGVPVIVQTGGTMTFTAEQTVNTFNNSTLGSGNVLVPGEAYYLDALFEIEPVAANAYCVPLGLAISPTEFRLRLGLPVKAVVGA